jgi:hypothetical protein
LNFLADFLFQNQHSTRAKFFVDILDTIFFNLIAEHTSLNIFFLFRERKKYYSERLLIADPQPPDGYITRKNENFFCEKIKNEQNDEKSDRH